MEEKKMKDNNSKMTRLRRAVFVSPVDVAGIGYREATSPGYPGASVQGRLRDAQLLLRPDGLVEVKTTMVVKDIPICFCVPLSACRSLELEQDA